MLCIDTVRDADSLRHPLVMGVSVIRDIAFVFQFGYLILQELEL